MPLCSRAAANPGILILGRALLGLGVASFLVASLAVYARRFPHDRFATLTGLQIGLGTIGTLMATAPLAFSTATIGWRGSFLVVGVCTGLIGLLIALVVPTNGPAHDRARGRCARARRHRGGDPHAVGRTAVRDEPRGLFVFRSIVGLWGGPYLTHIYGYNLEARGSFLLIPVLAQIVGSLVWGPIDRLIGSHKLPVLVGAGATAAALAYLALVGTLTPIGLVAWFAIFGLVAPSARC